MIAPLGQLRAIDSISSSGSVAPGTSRATPWSSNSKVSGDVATHVPEPMHMSSSIVTSYPMRSIVVLVSVEGSATGEALGFAAQEAVAGDPVIVGGEQQRCRLGDLGEAGRVVAVHEGLDLLDGDRAVGGDRRRQ